MQAARPRRFVCAVSCVARAYVRRDTHRAGATKRSTVVRASDAGRVSRLTFFVRSKFSTDRTRMRQPSRLATVRNAGSRERLTKHINMLRRRRLRRLAQRLCDVRAAAASKDGRRE